MAFYYTINQFLPRSRQPHSLTLLLSQIVIKAVGIDGKASFFKHLRIIAAELAHVVILTETAFALLRVSD